MNCRETLIRLVGVRQWPPGLLQWGRRLLWPLGLSLPPLPLPQPLRFQSGQDIILLELPARYRLRP